MHWRVEEHVAEVERAARAAGSCGADLVLFPELTLTGLHTKVPELLDPAAIDRALRSVGAACRANGIAAAVGAPVWVDRKRPLNAFVIFGSSGERLFTSPKLRLMPPGEPLVFEPGEERPVLELADTTLAVVICREILDHAELTRELRGRARILLWPGVMARGEVDPGNPEDYTLQAIRIAREQEAWLLHSNWANNVQLPGLPHTGKSMVVSPAGTIALEAPAHAPGLLLAWESSEKAWIPEAAL